MIGIEMLKNGKRAGRIGLGFGLCFDVDKKLAIAAFDDGFFFFAVMGVKFL